MSFSSADPVPPVELSQSDNLKLAQWIVPNETTPSAFNLDLNIDGAAKTTAAPKAVRAEALVAGRAYHLYVVWHGTYLNFTYEEAVQAYKITMTTTDPIGSTIYLRDYSTDAWIDLNGNGEKDEGELMSGHYERQEFTIRAQTLTIYGKVTELVCSYSNLTALDVTKNTELRKLSCYNNLLTALDVTKNTALTVLDCSGNSLTTLDLTKNTELQILLCYSNDLQALNLTKNTKLTQLKCYENSLKTLEVTKNTALTNLECYSNSLAALDLTRCTALTYLNCHSNSLAALDVTKNTALTYLRCYSNSLVALDVTRCTALTELSCHSNALASLDVTKNTALTLLNCSSNTLATLDLTKSAALTYLDCSSNSLATLDVTKSTALETLLCYSNAISGESMSILVNSLCNRSAVIKGKIYIIDTRNASEKNVCTTAQVDIATAKNWQVLDNKNWVNYPGS